MIGMEAAVVSGILKIVGNKLAPLLINEYSSVVGVREDLEELHGLVEEINCCLGTVGNEAVGGGTSYNWSKRLKEVSYEVDDLVDEFLLEAEKHDADGGKHTVSKYLLTKPKIFLFQCKLAHKIKAIKKRFAAIVKQRNDIRVITNTSAVGHPIQHIDKAIVPLLHNVDETLVVGRDQETHNIISKLVSTNDQQKINIVSIIGLGGSGKTTLAKLVFNDRNTVKKHFDVTLWVHVSQDFDIEKLIKKLFEAFADENPGQHALPYMSKKISDKLTGKRFLLVMDDVWTESPIHMEEFMVYLKSGAPGSGILLTTRSQKVAETVRSTYLFNLPFLSADDSWQLFQQSLAIPAECLELEFVKVGKDIVNKCGRMPLAIKVLAGILRGKERIEEWQAMRGSSLFEIEGAELSISVFACLRLSYFHLPSHLKQCFTLCSLFPKGHNIVKEQLIDLWIVHDMIAPENGVDNLEYIGHKCFNSLVQMSFLQDVEETAWRTTCKMHDLVHDLARSILGNEISLVLSKKATNSSKSCRYFSLTEQPRNHVPKNIYTKTRAIYVDEGDEKMFGKALKNAKHLRSITVESIAAKYVPTRAISPIFQAPNLKYIKMSRLQCVPKSISDVWGLQALHVTDSCLVELPESIGMLQKLRTLNLSDCWYLKRLPDSIGDCHMISSIDLCNCHKLTVLPDSISGNTRLRVLRLGRTKIERVPSSITILVNLEYLDLEECSELVELPEGIGDLIKLQVLNLDGCYKLRAMPVGIGELSRLENLSLFVVGDDEKSARISELRNMTRLSGDLAIRGIAHVMDPEDAHQACLKQKTNLEKLTLHWWRSCRVHTNLSIEMGHAVLDALEPPSGIKELDIDGCATDKCAGWLLKQVGGSQFPCLTVLTLSRFPYMKHLEGLVELPRLQNLELRWMHALESISGGPFPSLAELKMYGLSSLGEVWLVAKETAEEEGQMQNTIEIGTCLSNLHVEDCPKLMMQPCLPASLEYLVSDERLLQLRGEPSSSSFPSHLKELTLKGMEGSSSPPVSGSGCGWEMLRKMTALESLTIVCCPSLIELAESIRSLTSLRSLRIERCSGVRMLPECLGELRSLQKMRIESCDSLSSLLQSPGQLTSLQQLEIGWCSALGQLPESLGELRSLRKFEIRDLRGLTCLPQSMCHLTSLEALLIWSCPAIKSLPEGIKGLTALESLHISGCPDLERRCERGKGEDWHLISHIPHVWIGNDW